MLSVLRAPSYFDDVTAYMESAFMQVNASFNASCALYTGNHVISTRDCYLTLSDWHTGFGPRVATTQEQQGSAMCVTYIDFTAFWAEYNGLVADTWRLPREGAIGQCHFPHSRNLLMLQSNKASQGIVVASTYSLPLKIGKRIHSFISDWGHLSHQVILED